MFKPDPAIYRMAGTYLGLDGAEIMMVASHKYDIRAAAGLGFRTAFVAGRWNSGSAAMWTWPTQTSSTSTRPIFLTLQSNSTARSATDGTG